MKIFLLGGDMPYRDHTEEHVSAVNISLYELLRSLRQLGHELTLQVMFNAHRQAVAMTVSEAEELRSLEGLGIRVLSPIYKEHYLRPSQHGSALRRMGMLARILTGSTDMSAFYPAVHASRVVCERIRSANPDIILSAVSPEGLAATYGFRERPKISWQGSIDFLPAEVRLRDRQLFQASPTAPRSSIIRQRLAAWRQRLWLLGFKRAHVQLMENVDGVACAGAHMVEFYKTHGQPNAFYLGTMWVDPHAKEARHHEMPDRSPAQMANRTINIVGYLGYLGHTSSTYGLKFLLMELAPALEKLMRGLDYTLQIIGSGEVVPALRPWLKQPHIVQRGWVQDLDRELQTSDAFLVLDNADSYVVSCTRHILAWAMGLCLVAHVNSKKAFPELKHLENALLGSTPQEIAQQIVVAATNPEVNQRIRAGGRSTYEQRFRPAIIAEQLAREMASVIARTSASHRSIQGHNGHAPHLEATMQSHTAT